ncbi:MAG: PIN domain-containing protein [Xanthomonadaceae bacterium]|nr:PIN domain-containing protein [Xanthomonadaceae bacterium]
MTLVDTSVWIAHFRNGVSRLADLLESNRVLMHPFVLGEIACSNLSDRQDTLQLLSNLSGAPVASNGEVMTFIDSNCLMGKGIGFVDAHLLAAVALAADATLWTHDRRLRQAAKSLRLVNATSRE